MSRVVLPLALGAGILVAVIVLLHTQQRPRASFPAPNFRLPTLEGKTIGLSDYRGRVLFLNFWATWCPPCREEMPSMERLHRKMANRHFAMVAINQDTSIEPVREFVRSLGLTFTVALDPEGTLPARYGVTGYPETFLVDSEGQVIRHIIGPLDWDEPNIVAFIEQLVAKAEAQDRQTPIANR